MTAPKNSLFLPNQTLNVRGRLLDMRRPLLMGILNLSPDSFYRASALGAADAPLQAALEHAGRMLEQGADFLDIGGMSTRPGAELISPEQDSARVLPIVEALVKAFPAALLSVDTVYSGTARMALEAGAHIINDVSAGQMDEQMWSVPGEFSAPYVLMHHRGIPAGKSNPDREHNLQETYDWLADRLMACREAGIKDVILDPGFGFGKSLRDQYRMLNGLVRLSALGAPLLIGLSRKSMIRQVLGVETEDALNGTTVLNTMALLGGASILRVHDVKEARQIIDILEYSKASSADTESVAAVSSSIHRPPPLW